MNEIKKTYEIRFSTNWKKDGIIKKYLKKIGFKNFRVDFINPDEVVYGFDVDSLDDLFIKVITHSGLNKISVKKDGEKLIKR